MEVSENCYYNEPSNEFRAQIHDCTRPCYPPECNGLKGPMNKSSVGLWLKCALMSVHFSCALKKVRDLFDDKIPWTKVRELFRKLVNLSFFYLGQNY